MQNEDRGSDPGPRPENREFPAAEEKPDLDLKLDRGSELILIERLLGGRDAGRIARGLLDRFGSLDRAARASAREFRAAGGLAAGAASRLEAAFALGRLMEQGRGPRRRRFTGGRAVFDFVQTDLRLLEQEVFETLLLDARNGLIRRERVSMGTLTGSLVHPREVFRQAVREAAASVVLIHNHPSGDPSPSPEDIEVTERLVSVGEILGIRVLDHVVVGDGVYVSFAERGLIGGGATTRVAERST